MLYKYRELRRLWKVEVYEGDPNDPETPTRTETVIALNAVDANRKVAGRLVKEPEPLHYITWPIVGSPQIYRIDDPSIGPVGDVILPSIPLDPNEEQYIAMRAEKVQEELEKPSKNK